MKKHIQHQTCIQYGQLALMQTLLSIPHLSVQHVLCLTIDVINRLGQVWSIEFRSVLAV